MKGFKASFIFILLSGFAVIIAACGSSGGGGGGGGNGGGNTAPLAALLTSMSIAKTGQATSYAAGDDGDLQKGVAWPDPRFTDNGDGTVTDNLTGLVWLQDANCFGTRDWTQALTDSNALANGQCGLIDGSQAGDWRLPNRKELMSLIDRSTFNPALPAWHPFTNVQAYYWSSTTYAKDTSKAWDVCIWDGYADFYHKTDVDDYVWPVRSGVSGTVDLPRTGQTTSYAAGDDGGVQKGVAWPSPRFVVGRGVEAGCVADILTGLIWVKTPDSTSRTWADALTYAEGLSLCGHSDWRLPNVNELESLMNAGQLDTAAWLNTQGFSNVQAGYYWSSTSYVYDTSGAWIVVMWNGYVDGDFKAGIHYVWPVRGGQ